MKRRPRSAPDAPERTGAHARLRTGRLAVAGALCVLACAQAAAQRIEGRVVDAASGAAVPQARVTATSTGTGATVQTLTSATGRFSLEPRGGAPYRIGVARLGYRDAPARALAAGAGDTVRVTVALSAVALTLEPVAATATMRRLEVDGVFQQVPPDSAEAPAPPEVRAGWGSLRVWGTLPIPSPCFQVAGAGYVQGRVLTLVVDARPGEYACAESGGLFRYRANLRGVRAGRYTVRVMHTYQGGPWEAALALDTTAAVR